MTTYISILRGINVSGHKMIRMDALRKLYTELDFINIRTYIQSGNVIFQYKKMNQIDLEKIISDKIFKQFSYEVPVLILELEELKSIIKSNPFLRDMKKDTSYLHITFLSDEPEKENINKINAEQYKPDEFKFGTKSIYIYCPNNYGNSKLSNNFFENKLKVSATTRNWKTVNELFNIAQKMES